MSLLLAELSPPSPLLGEIWIDVLVLIFMLLLSAFFSGSETAITAFNAIKIESLIREKGDPKGMLSFVIKRRSRLITSLLVGNNLVNNFSAILTSNLFAIWLGNAGIGIATAIITILLLIFGEITPKTLAIVNVKSTFKLALPFVYWLYRVLEFFRIIQVLEKITQGIIDLIQGKRTTTADVSMASEQELKMMIELLKTGSKMKGLSTHEILDRAVKLEETVVRDIVVPRVEMRTVTADESLEEVIKVCLDTGYSRLPVQKESKDEIIGIIHFKQVIQELHSDQPPRPITEICEKPFYLPESKNAIGLMGEMLKKRFHLAIVVDEYGGTVGLVTLEDILEELVGEIYDESDQDIAEE